jgi:hypothetical protein
MMRASNPVTLALLIGFALPAIAPAQPPESANPADKKIDPKLDKILTEVEAEGDKIDSFSAKVKYTVTQVLAGEKIIRYGDVQFLRVYEKDPNARPPTEAEKRENPHAGQRQKKVLFRVRFDRMVNPTVGFVSKKKEIYVFDGRWLHELREKTSELVHREIVPEGQQLDPTRLGEGPFPLPFGQKKSHVLARFKAELIPSADGDPKATDHVKLTPRKGTDMARKYKRIEFYVARDNLMPVRMVMENHNDEEKLVELTDLKLNPKLDEDDFDLKRPGRGYNESYIRLPTRKKDAGENEQE